MSDGPSNAAQTTSPSFRPAALDQDFLLGDSMRGVRFLLEFAKAEEGLKAWGVRSTIVVFGSARLLEEAAAKQALHAVEMEAARTPQDPTNQKRVAIAQRKLALSKYYDMAREFGRLVSSTCQIDGRCDYVIVTGGGPGIMEAANRGAQEMGALTVGLNIVLPHEQSSNPYISPSLNFKFHYFALRKMHFMMRAKALVAFPGGFGTLDELFEVITLVQTRKAKPVPIILFGSDYWKRLFNFEVMIEEGAISPDDLKLFKYVDDPQLAWNAIKAFYEL